MNGRMDADWKQIRLETTGTCFADSFLLGNGRFGAALCFQPERDAVLLSHTAFWSGAPAKTHGRSGAPEAFRKARQLSEQGDHLGAWEALEGFIGVKENYGTNLPVGQLVITQEISAAENYCRSLCLEDGTACCEFYHEKGFQTRQARCPEHPAMLELDFRDTAYMRMAISVEGPCIRKKTVSGDCFLFTAQALETFHSDGTCGIRLAGLLRAEADGGVRAEGNALVAEGRRIRLCLTMETDFPVEEECCLPIQKVLLHRMEEGGTDSSVQRLVPGIELEGEDRINRQAFFGHYLLRSAVTKDSPLPPALQGVWNDGEACRLGWTNDYHLDVNTQMNLWCADALEEGERLKPLFRFMLNRLIPEGRKTARGYYGLPGAVAELSTNCFGYAAPYWGRPLAPCPACGFWLCELVIRHARCHPEDRGFLEQTALPILDPFVEFALAYVTENREGWLTGGPAISPENGFIYKGGTVYASMGTTFENEQLRILLEGYAEVCKQLHMENERTRQASDTLKRLPPLRINRLGEIAEYAHDLPSAVPNHRHMSHLSGLYPGKEIRPECRDLAAAAEKTIRSRILPEESFESTPWARVMLGLYEARLGHGEQALAQLEKMLEEHVSDSLLFMHPAIPGTMNPSPVWELDGNTGFTAVVLEMLIRHSGNRLTLLPALPRRWRKGRIRNVRAGPWHISELCWEMPGCMNVCLEGLPGQAAEVEWRGRIITRPVPENGVLSLAAEDWENAETADME